MTLAEFIKTYVCHNTLIRLWIEDIVTDDGLKGHRMLHSGDKEVCMEWEILGGSCWAATYVDWLVIGVTDILCDTYKEAVNIVIQKGVSNDQTRC